MRIFGIGAAAAASGSRSLWFFSSAYLVHADSVKILCLC